MRDLHHMGGEAFGVLRENDHGSYTVPTKGPCPFQWNRDSNDAGHSKIVETFAVAVQFSPGTSP
jgi:hypothetical protein